MPPSRRDSPYLALGFCLVVAALLRFGLVWGYDLRGALGPDAPGAAAAAFSGPFGHPYPLHPLFIRVLALPSGDPVQAALLLSLAAGLATVGAAWLMGRVLTDGRDGRSVGLVAASAPLLLQASLLRGGDALAVALAWWGVALAWWGCRALAKERGVAKGPRVAIVAAGLLWGLSAAAKPIALPAGVFLLPAAMLGGRRCLPWLLGGLGAGVLIALPFLGPFLRPESAMGLLGSWWLEGVPSITQLPRWSWDGLETLAALLRDVSWAQLGPMAFLAVIGCAVVGPRRDFRLAVFVAGTAVAVLMAAMLGSRLQVRYLCAASLGWVALAGLALTPGSLRRPDTDASPSWRRALLGPLPLSLAITVFVVAGLRFWDGMGLLRAQEEGAAVPEGVFSGWAEEWRPRDEYLDSSICGALELEELAERLGQTLPSGATVVTLPLRDGRGWHLLGPLAAARPDLTLLEMVEECCPAGPERCSERLLDELASSGGGAFVLPLEPAGRCETGALPAGLGAWLEASRPLVTREGYWYGSTVVPARNRGVETHLCQALGGRAPAPPARP